MSASIHQLTYWSQEYLAYEFGIIHRVNKIMKNIDGLSRYIDPLIH